MDTFLFQNIAMLQKDSCPSTQGPHPSLLLLLLPELTSITSYLYFTLAFLKCTVYTLINLMEIYCFVLFCLGVPFVYLIYYSSVSLCM